MYQFTNVTIIYCRIERIYILLVNCYVAVLLYY